MTTTLVLPPKSLVPRSGFPFRSVHGHDLSSGEVSASKRGSVVIFIIANASLYIMGCTGLFGLCMRLLSGSPYWLTVTNCSTCFFFMIFYISFYENLKYQPLSLAFSLFHSRIVVSSAAARRVATLSFFFATCLMFT